MQHTLKDLLTHFPDNKYDAAPVSSFTVHIHKKILGLQQATSSKNKAFYGLILGSCVYSNNGCKLF